MIKLYIKKIKNHLLNLNYYLFVVPKGNKPIENYVFVTGSDSSHFKSAVNCIKSIKSNSNPSVIIFWDLGCSKEEILGIKSLGVTLKTFPYKDYPSFYNIKVDAGKYAWKSAIIKKTISEYKLPTIWFDAGNILKNPFKILTTLEVLGFYSPYSNGKVKEWTFPSVLNRFSYINNIAELRNLNGACICFNPSNNIAMELLENWEYLSTDINFIAPIGSSRLNHRQDQSLLTLLAHKYNLAKNMPHGYLDFSIHNDID